MSDDLQAIIDCVAAGTQSETDLAALRQALRSGQISLATGERAVAVGGAVTDAIIVTGDGNVLRIFRGPDAATIQKAVCQVLDAISTDRYDRSLQDYFRALRAYCTNYPYLALEDLLGRKRKSLDEVYVPLRARAKTESGRPDREETNIADVLRRATSGAGPRHILILGEPGAGKSTLLRQIAKNAWDAPAAIGLDRPYLPMVVRLQSLALAEGASLERRLVNALHRAGELTLQQDPPDGFLLEWPRRMDARWLLLLDGLDEVPADSYSALVQWLRDLAKAIKTERYHVVLTSRPVGDLTQDLEEMFAVYELLLFTPKQQQKFAQQWFEDEAGKFQQELDRMHVDALSGIPLLLAIAAAVYSKDHHLPERRAGIYERFVSIWLEEARIRGVKEELGQDFADLARPALEHLALVMTDHPEISAMAALSRIAAEFLREAAGLPQVQAEEKGKRFLEVLSRHSGVLIRRNGNCEWLHQTFREYLAACSLRRQLETQDSNAAEVLRVGERLERLMVIQFLVQICDHPEVARRHWIHIITVGILLATILQLHEALTTPSEAEEGGGGGGHH